MSVEITCQVCEIQFEVVDSRLHTARYCSQECKAEGNRRAARASRVARPCATCRTVMRLAPWELESRWTCSRKCAVERRKANTLDRHANGQLPGWEFRCGNCGEARRSRKRGQKYCNRKCRWIVTRGPNSHGWAGGASEIRVRIMSWPEYRLWREVVLERDGNACTDCGSREGLHAHHVKLMSKYPDLMFDVANGKTVCEPCHVRIHKSLGKDKDSRPLLEWLKARGWDDGVKLDARAPRPCDHCGVMFEPPLILSRFCTVACHYADRNRRARERTRAELGESRTCSECGTSFVPRSKVHWACSVRCKNRAAQRRRAPRRPARSATSGAKKATGLRLEAVV